MPKVNVPSEYLGVIYPDNPSPRRSASTSRAHPQPDSSRRQRGQARTQSSHVHPPATTYPLRHNPYHQPRPNFSALQPRPPITSPPPHVLPEPYRSTRSPVPVVSPSRLVDQRPPRNLPQYPPAPRSDPLRDLADLALSRSQPSVRPRRARVVSPIIHEIRPLRIVPNPHANSLPQLAPGVEHMTTGGSFYAPHVFDGTSLPRVKSDVSDQEDGFEDVRKFDNLPTLEEMAKHAPKQQPGLHPLGAIASKRHPVPPPTAHVLTSTPPRRSSTEKQDRPAAAVVAASRRSLGDTQGTAAPAKRRKHMFGELPNDGQPSRSGPFANLLKSGPSSPRHASEAPNWQERSRKMMHIKSMDSPPSPISRALPLLDGRPIFTPSTSRASSFHSASISPPRPEIQLDRRGSGSNTVFDSHTQSSPPVPQLARRCSAAAIELGASGDSSSSIVPPYSSHVIDNMPRHLYRYKSIESSQSLAATQQSDPSSQLASQPMSINNSSSTVKTISSQESALLTSPHLDARPDRGRNFSFHLPQIDPLGISCDRYGVGLEAEVPTSLEVMAPKRQFWNEASTRGQKEPETSRKTEGGEEGRQGIEK